MDKSIWPHRVVPLLGSAQSWPWLSDDMIQQVRAAVVDQGQRDVLDKPFSLVTEAGDRVLLLGLVLLGSDGLAIGNSLILRAAIQRDNARLILNLNVLPYGRVAGTGKSPIGPGKADDLLGGVVTRLQTIPGLVLDRSDGGDDGPPYMPHV